MLVCSALFQLSSSPLLKQRKMVQAEMGSSVSGLCVSSWDGDMDFLT